MTTTVLGAGISGLSAAYYLLRRFGKPVAVYEASNRVGGWIRTEKYRDKGFVFEAGPRTIRPKGISGANTLELIEELELPVDTINSKHEAARNRMIFAKGELCPLPSSFGEIFKTLPPFTKPLISTLYNELFIESKKIRRGDESIYDFIERRFGHELADYAISPLICGICAGDAKEISVRFLMDEIFEKEQKWGGVIKGMVMARFADRSKSKQSEGIFGDSLPSLYKKSLDEKWSMYRVQGGLELLPRKLGIYLHERNVKIHLSSECKEMIFTRNGVRMTIKGQEIETQHVVSALPSHKLAACVKNQHPSLAAQLLSIPYVNVGVVNLQYSSQNLLKYKAFGFLVPPIERLPILGVIFDSCCFDMQGNTVLTVMLGGRWFEQNFGKSLSQKEILDVAIKYVDSILGIDQEPKMARVHILQKCIPQYTVGHKQRVEDIRKYIQHYNLPLSLCGAAYDGVGINDVILSARKQIDALAVTHVD